MREPFLTFYRAGDEARLTLRPDMAAQFEAEGGRIPPGPAWTLTDDGGQVVAIGGLEPTGAATSLGWFLTADLNARQWVMVRHAARVALAWARRHAIRHVVALTDAARPGAVRMLEGMGFRVHEAGESEIHMILTMTRTEARQW